MSSPRSCRTSPATSRRCGDRASSASTSITTSTTAGAKETCLITGFAPRKDGLVLYLGPGLENKALTNKLGKHKTGKGCLYVKKLDDVDRGVLRDLIVTSVKAMRERYPRSN